MRVTTIAVNIDTVNPSIKLMPKPFTGPVPNWNKKTAAMMVVRLPSKMAEKAFS